MTTSAPSTSRAHGPTVRPSHSTLRASRLAARLSTTTSCPRARSALWRMLPTWPVPPGITIFMGTAVPLASHFGARGPPPERSAADTTRPLRAVSLEERREPRAATRHEVEEARGERREAGAGEAHRPLAPSDEGPEAHQESGRADPDFARIADDDELVAKPRDVAVAGAGD